MNTKECVVCGTAYEDRARAQTKRTCSKKCRNALYYAMPEKRTKRLFQMRISVLRSKGVVIHPELADQLYEELHETRCCQACGKIGSPFGKRRDSLMIDHDHKTNQVRGIICGGCNLALGHVKDNLQYLHGLVAYLDGSMRCH